MINQHYSDHQFPINSMITRICHIRISQSPIYIYYIYISSPNISYPYGGFLKWGYPQIIHFCFCFSAFPLKTIHFGGTPYFPLCLYVPIVYHIFPDFPPRCSYMFQYVRYIPYVFPYVPIVSLSIPPYGPYPMINQWNIQPVRRLRLRINHRSSLLHLWLLGKGRYGQPKLQLFGKR